MDVYAVCCNRHHYHILLIMESVFVVCVGDSTTKNLAVLRYCMPVLNLKWSITDDHTIYFEKGYVCAYVVHFQLHS